jgi:hypothetical protein
MIWNHMEACALRKHVACLMLKIETDAIKVTTIGCNVKNQFYRECAWTYGLCGPHGVSAPIAICKIAREYTHISRHVAGKKMIMDKEKSPITSVVNSR